MAQKRGMRIRILIEKEGVEKEVAINRGKCDHRKVGTRACWTKSKAQNKHKPHKHKAANKMNRTLGDSHFAQKTASEN